MAHRGTKCRAPGCLVEYHNCSSCGADYWEDEGYCSSDCYKIVRGPAFMEFLRDNDLTLDKFQDIIERCQEFDRTYYLWVNNEGDS